MTILREQKYVDVRMTPDDELYIRPSVTNKLLYDSLTYKDTVPNS
jgi:hypothetical protein